MCAPLNLKFQLGEEGRVQALDHRVAHCIEDRGGQAYFIPTSIVSYQRVRVSAQWWL
jgi:hypothetical protein